ncbi:MAG TPA: extradiol dioxygenase [Spirochaetia bacterium]|nr:extradiol dioxygenase [Spirochaetia bacterium]
MIYGAHALVYSRAPEETRAILEKVLTGNKVDAGGGWLIFALPPAEIAVHPTDGAPRHDLYLMCQDIEETIQELREKGVKFSKPVSEVSWGRTCAIALPGGGELGLYQPRHPTALARPSKAGAKSRAKAAKASGRKPRPSASKSRASRR